MIGLITGIIIWVAFIVLVYYLADNYDKGFTTFMIGGLLGGMFVAILTFAVLIPMISGIGKNYGIQEQAGYITNLGERGIIWKTWEGEMQKGVGEQSSIEDHFKFSTTDNDMAMLLNSYLGSKKRVKVKCNQWLIMPYKMGSSKNKVVSVIPIN